MRKYFTFLIPVFIVLSCQYENEEELYPGYFKSDSTIGNLIAHYMLDGNACDTSGNGNNGMLYGSPELTSDRYDNPNSAIHFDGKDDFMLAEIGNHDPMAISMWFAHRNNDPSEAYILFDYGVNAFRSEVDMTSGATRTYGYFNDTNIIQMRSPKMKFSSDMIWHHLYIDSGSDTIRPRMYIDGMLEGMLEEKQILTIITNLIYFGRAFTDKFTEASYYDGKIDDIRIYNRILSEEEVLSLFDNYSENY